MEIDFNNVRRQAVLSYEKLVKRLNNSIHRNNEMAEFPNGHYGSLKGCVVIAADDIQEIMDDLRMMLGSIAACYDEEDENFQDIYQEIFPEGQSLTCFNG